MFLRSRVAGLDAFEDLFSMDLNIFRCIDTDSHLHPFDAQNGDFDVIVDAFGG